MYILVQLLKTTIVTVSSVMTPFQMRAAMPSPRIKAAHYNPSLMIIKLKQVYQRDAEAPHICSDVIVRFGGIWGIYSLRLQKKK